MNILATNNKIIQWATAVLMAIFLSLSLHAQAAANSSAFNHTQTGFILKDVHLTLRCEQCHVDGIFKNTPKNCAGCHTIGTRVAATPQPINHVQTTAACDTCHTSGSNFLVKSFSHMSVTGSCSTCHNGQSLGVMSKPVTHFPTLLPCENCHTNTTTFLSWQMGAAGHIGITSGCATCHSGQYPNVVSVPAMPTFHVQTNGQDCGNCHGFSNFNVGGFLNPKASYDHSLSTGQRCNTCHGATSQLSGITVVPAVPANHITIPAGADCSSCHNNTTTFFGAYYDHAAVAAGTCDTCHTGAYPGVMTKGLTHIPTQSYKCDACHTSINTVGFSSFYGATYHDAPQVTTAAGSCSTCHSGSYAASPELAQGIYSGASGMHIPLSGSQTCDICHTPSNTNQNLSFAGAQYHTVVTATAGSCSTCHSGSFNTGAWTAKGLTSGASGTHIPTSGASCDVCHTSANTALFTSFAGATYHSSVTAAAGNCASCHSGSYATGAWLANPIGGSHIPVTGISCDACHTAANTAQYSVSYNFAGTTYHGSVSATSGGCNVCHNGSHYAAPENAYSQSQYAGTAMSSPHITTSAPCDQCHTATTTSNYTTFLGALYNHTNVVAGSCGNGGCHDGINAKGKPSTHLTTSLACDSAGCHTVASTNNYTTFLNGTYHPATPVTAGTCGNTGCHDGSAAGLSANALGKPAAHPPVTGGLTCDSASGCHSTAAPVFNTWAGTQYHPNGAAAGNCAASNCHTGTLWGTAVTTASNHPLSQTPALSCDSASGCHSAVAPSYATWAGTMYHPNGVAAGNCAGSNCHAGTKLWGTALPIAASHPPQGSITSCDSASGCHSSVAPSYSIWAGTMYHPSGSVTGGCNQSNCHTGTPLWGSALPTNTGHVTYTGDCVTCHTIASSANYTTWLGATYTHDANAVGKCNQCHDGVQANGQSSPHVPTSGTCDAAGCHTTATTQVANGYPAGWLGATFQPHPGTATTCNSCHGTTSALYPGVSSQTSSPGGLAGLNGQPHQVTSAQCSTCHSNTTSWAGAGFDHTTAAAGSCVNANCHGAGGGGKGIASYPTHIQITISCDSGGCHTKFNGTTVTTFAGGMWNHTYNPSAYPTCASCHGVFTTFGTYGAAGKVSNHIPTTMVSTADCNFCHTVTAPTTVKPTAGSAAWKQTSYPTMESSSGHGGIQGGAPNYCVTCHLSGVAYLMPNTAKDWKSHNGASASKDCSSTSCHKPLGKTGSSYTNWGG